ncbi:MAG: hypothetical protein JWN48_563 [Myxococcaceae bacterium]|nr:hypothetical protein [Myxococcaceae bacterium]
MLGSRAGWIQCERASHAGTSGWAQSGARREHAAPGLSACSMADAATAGALGSALLGAVAGAVDAVGYICCKGLLPSHLAASLVALATGMARYSAADMRDRVLLFALFLLVMATVLGFAHYLALRELPVVQSLLTLLTFTLGALCVAGSVLAHDTGALLGPRALGVVSMAIQNSLMRICLPKANATTVMTGNLTQSVIAAAELLGRRLGLVQSDGQEAELRAKLTLAITPLLGFAVGSSLAAYFASRHGLVAFWLPFALAAFVTARSWAQLTTVSTRMDRALLELSLFAAVRSGPLVRYPHISTAAHVARLGSSHCSARNPSSATRPAYELPQRRRRERWNSEARVHASGFQADEFFSLPVDTNSGQLAHIVSHAERKFARAECACGSRLRSGLRRGRVALTELAGHALQAYERLGTHRPPGRNEVVHRALAANVEASAQ